MVDNGSVDQGSIPGRTIASRVISCLTLSTIRYGSRVSRAIQGEGVALSPTPTIEKVTIEKGAFGSPTTTVGYIYIYIYIYVCVCVCVCVCIGLLIFINAYFIKQYGHVLSTYFCICPFQLSNWFYSMRRDISFV